MGLDFRNSDASWGYFGFRRFRERLAELDGYDLDELYMCYDKGYYPKTTMLPFYIHPDNEGKMGIRELKKLYPRFCELMNKMKEKSDTPDDYDVENGFKLLDTIKHCINDKEPLIFE